METARVVAGHIGDDIDYFRWFDYVLKSGRKMPPDHYDQIKRVLVEYATKVGKIDALAKAMKFPIKADIFTKLVYKILENYKKLGCIRLSCKQQKENTIFTAVQTIDSLLEKELESVYAGETTKHSAWEKVRERLKTI